MRGISAIRNLRRRIMRPADDVIVSSPSHETAIILLENSGRCNLFEATRVGSVTPFPLRSVASTGRPGYIFPTPERQSSARRELWPGQHDVTL